MNNENKKAIILYSGKSKTLFKKNNEVYFIYKDQMLSQDWRYSKMEWKWKTLYFINKFFFLLLEQHTIKTHIISFNDEDLSTHIIECEKTNIEVVVRAEAFWWYLKRHPNVPSRFLFPTPIVEFFYKDDLLLDPFLIFDEETSQLKPFDESIKISHQLKYSKTLIKIFEQKALSVFQIISNFWKDKWYTLIDMKIEFWLNENWEAIVIDSIDPDARRLQSDIAKNWINEHLDRDILYNKPFDPKSLQIVLKNYNKITKIISE